MTKFAIYTNLDGHKASEIKRILDKYAYLAHMIASGEKSGEAAMMASGALAAVFVELANLLMYEVKQEEN